MSGGVKKIAQVAVGAVVGFVQGGPVGAVVGAGLAFYAASQQEALTNSSSTRASEPSAQTVRSSKAPIRFILGRVSTGGVLVWAQEQSGGQGAGEWVHLVYVLSEGPVSRLEDIFLGQESISKFGDDATYELVVNPTTVNAFLKANCPDWKDTQIGRGLSYVRLSLRYNAEKFPSGIPDVRFVVRGRDDVYDPRTGASGYTQNTALHILWYLRTRCGVPDDEIVFSTFASAANVCEELVTNADGTSSQRYTTACVIAADEQRTQVIQKLEASCAGKLIRVGGRWMLQAGAYYGPYDFEITEDMVIGTIKGGTESTNDAAINTVRGTFIDTSQAWAETDYPEVVVSQWLAEDGGEAAETLSYPYVTDAYQPQRLANIELRRRRAGGAISIPMNFAGYNCRPGRVVRVNLPSLNILGEFIVTNWAMGAKEGCTVSLAQYEQAIFDDAVGQPYNPLGFISLPSGGLGAPTGLVWAPDATSEVVQGVLSWNQPAGIVSAFVVTVRQGGAVVQAHTIPATSSQCNISGLGSGSYTMSIAAVGPMARSGEASITVSIDGPPMPEACVVQASIDSITLIPSNTLRGLNGGFYEYFFSTNPKAPASDAKYLGQGLTFTHTGLGFYTNYYYFVRSVNAYGKSAFLYVAAATSNDVGAYLEALTGRVTEAQIGKHLLDRIDLVDGDGPASVNKRLKEAKDLLGGQIAAVDTELASVKGELQEQIDTIADLADSMPYKPDQTYAVGQGVLGADGIIYQAVKAVPVNMPPPNTTYWLNVGQAVVTANGLAARVQTVETKVTSVEDVNTSQAQQITGLRTDVDGKASASSVQTLGNRVTSAENSLTSQGSAITGLDNSLKTTNTNVGNAQTAANNAATLAGSKGKVLVQTATPAAADQLAQNLWIDITGGANTPKRWNGSAWAAVTDKVATDAATAAANALTQVQTKADASAVSALTNRVTANETAISSQSSSIVSLNNNLSYAGGENLVYNPDFVKPGADGTVAEGYVADAPGSPGASTGVFSLVPSWMNSAEKAQRITVTGLNASALYRSIRNNGNRLPKAAEGQPICSSIHLRGTAGLGFRMFIQQVNASGGVLTTTNTVMYSLTGSTQRIALAVPSPVAGTAALVMFYRVYGSETVSDGYIEMARPQVEYGNVATGWSNNGQVNTADLITTSSAVSSLGSRVDQQGAALTSTSNSLVSLSNTVAGVQSSLGASGLDPASGALWNFDTGADGWIPANSTLSMASPGVLRQTATSGDPSIRVDGLSINGALYTKVRASITRRAGAPATDWDGLMFYATSAHGFTASYYKSIPNPNLAVGESKVIEFDMASLTAGGNDWATNTITSLRLDLGLSGSGVFDFEWIVVGRVSPAASSRALDSLTSTVNQQGGNLTSVSARTTSLENTVKSAVDGVTANATGLSSLKSTVEKQGSDFTATAQKVDGITAQITPDLTGDDGWNVGEDTVSAGTVTLQSVAVDATLAVAQRVDSVTAAVGQTNAALSSEQTARATADGALSSRVDTAQATANGATAAVQQTSSALANTNGKLAAIWSVRMELASNGQPYAAGFGLGLEAGSGGATSQFIVRADTFLVMNTNTQTPQSFFAITGGQTFIQAAYIQDGTITNAKIGSYISSTNYVAGQSGWILNKNGTLEINGMVAGGGRLVITNRSVRVYDNNNVKRVQLGDLTE